MSEEKGGNGPLGRGAGATATQLIIASIIVGAIFSFIGVGPREFWSGIFDSVKGVIGTLGENISEVVVTLISYFLIGAAIVVPIWFIARMLSRR